MKKIARMIKRDYYTFKPGPTPTSLINVKMPMKQRHDLVQFQHDNRMHMLPENCRPTDPEAKKHCTVCSHDNKVMYVDEAIDIKSNMQLDRVKL